MVRNKENLVFAWLNFLSNQSVLTRINLINHLFRLFYLCTGACWPVFLYVTVNNFSSTYENRVSCQQQPDCYFLFYLSKKACVFSGWGCDVQLKGRIETDYLVNSWHPLAAWNRPEHQGLICKWITPSPGPPLLLPSPLLPTLPPFLVFSFLVCVCVCPFCAKIIFLYGAMTDAVPGCHCFPSVFLGLWGAPKDFHMWL